MILSNLYIYIICRFRHPNFVELMGHCQNPLAIIYQFMENGSLSDHLHSGKVYIVALNMLLLKLKCFQCNNNLHTDPFTRTNPDGHIVWHMPGIDLLALCQATSCPS